MTSENPCSDPALQRDAIRVPVEDFDTLMGVVVALAESDPSVHDYDSHRCGLCDAWVPTRLEHHEADCPWRMAREALQ